MRLLTHNMLQCNVKKCTNKNDKYPLLLANVTDVVEEDIEMDREFLERLILKLNWQVLVDTCRELGWGTLEIPPMMRQVETTENLQDKSNQMDLNEDDTTSRHVETDSIPYDSEEWWTTFHTLLFNKKIVQGEMVCRSCGHVFPILNGIPNMLVREDEA